MDDWNDFGAVRPPHAPPPPAHRYSSASSHSSLSQPSLVLDDRSDRSDPSNPSLPSVNRPPSNSRSSHDVTNDRGSFLSSLPFLSSRRRNDTNRPPSRNHSPASTPATMQPGLVPLERNAHADRTIEDPQDVISSGSESEVREPQSSYMPSRHLLSPDPLSLQSDSGILLKKGELDDVPIDFEFNVEGFRLTGKHPLNPSSSDGEAQSSIIASSVLRLEKTYTKLEVISSKEIKSLVSCFNTFIVISIIWTLAFVIAAHTIFSTNQGIPIPVQLLSEDQKVGPPHFVDLSILERSQSIRMSSSAAPHPHSLSSIWTPQLTHLIHDELHCNGLYWTFDGIMRGEKRPHLCHHPTVTTSSRQEDGAPPLLPTPPPGTPFLEVYFIPTEVSVTNFAFKKTSSFVSVFLSLATYFIGVLYAIRIFRAGMHHLTHEQIWVFILIIVAALYFNVVEAVFRLVEQYSFDPANFTLPKWLRRIDDFTTVVRDTAFTVVTYFYLWASFHSYRILNPTKKLGFKDFYLVKALVLIPYSLFVPISYYAVNHRVSDVPLLSAPAFAFYYGGFQVWSFLTLEAITSILKTVYELVLTGIIILEASRTMRVLEKSSYMKYRTKRVGFRFFLYINFVFYVLFISLNCVLLFGIPKGESILALDPSRDFPAADVSWIWVVGPNILLFGYVLCTAYVHLPHTSVGPIKGWFKSSELAMTGSRLSFPNSESRSDEESPSIMGTEIEEKMKVETWTHDEDTAASYSDRDLEVKRPIAEPFTYRKGETKNCLQLKANCFTMQTHVIMFNFSWYVYYYNTPKLDNFRPKENPLPFAFKIAAHIKSDETDTQVLVVDCTDRIIVTFRGTTSLKNLRTSLRMNHALLPSVVSKNVSGKDESARLKRLFGTSYMRGKVHKGFATAYLSVADAVMEQVRILREKKKRAVFLTGHSLGGALATLCSLDLWVKLDISRSEIFVSTFGSPRVGNQEFAGVYGEVVPLHWRIVVHPDMVAKLPRVGYTHVGKKVVLTPHGEMLIDPSALEHRPWSGEAAGFAYHRKASYMLAMRAWCVRNHAMSYSPVFWPFPVRPDDERRFPGAFGDDSEVSSGRRVAAKIIRLDAMVDALGRTDTELANMAIVEKWARLTRRVLLNHRLMGKS